MRQRLKNSWHFFLRLRRRQLTRNTCCSRATELLQLRDIHRGLPGNPHFLPLAFEAAAVEGGVAGRSELYVSTAHFQLPSACFFHTSTYFPRSVIGFPFESFAVISSLPKEYPTSPDRETSTFVGCHFTFSPGTARKLPIVLRMSSLLTAMGSFGGRTVASSL